MAGISMVERLGYYDFFAGGGMANLGLGARWRCLMANDICEKKAWAYKANFAPASEFILADVRRLTTADLPGNPVLAWASFPCQDLSLAGKGQGLKGERSGSYWGFWRLMQAMEYEGRSVPIIVLENVVGTITANKGADFRVLLDALVEAGYRVGPLVVDAVHFLPQSRPRLFIIAVKCDQDIPESLLRVSPDDLWHVSRIRKTYEQLPRYLQTAWLWWNLPQPVAHISPLVNLIEDEPIDVEWHSQAETQRLLDLMAPLHRKKVAQAQSTGKKLVGTIYRRVRRDKWGNKAQRAEVRFDQISGCLRTGSGGSSRQFLIVVEGNKICTRLLSAREAARLMGLPETYKIPGNYNDAYHLIGDGVAVPVVSWLERHILWPVAACLPARQARNLPGCANKKDITSLKGEVIPIQQLLEFPNVHE